MTQAMNKSAQHYSAYLLRLWCTAEGESPEWRAALVDLATGERLGFTHAESLLAFLETLKDAPAPPPTQSESNVNNINDEER